MKHGLLDSFPSLRKLIKKREKVTCVATAFPKSPQDFTDQN